MSKIDPEKVSKIWQVIKTVIEIIIAALAGAVVGSCTDVVTLVASFFP